MNIEFLRALEQQGILGLNTKILANYEGYTLDGSSIPSRGELLVKHLEFTDTTVKITATPPFGETRYQIKMNDILEIDGMAPERIGRVFNINIDGSNRTMGRKRGRKPKIRSEV